MVMILRVILLLLGVVPRLSFIMKSGGNARLRSMAPLRWKVTVIHEGVETNMEVDENTSILEASLDAGVDLPHDCDLGVCLTCPSRIISGECDQSAGTLDDSVIEKGFALTCQSYPRSDVVITSIDEEELVEAQFSDRD